LLYIGALILLLLALLQSTLVPQVPVLGVRPDLVLLVVLAWVMVRGLYEGAVAAFCGGIALDLLSSPPMGAHALALLLTVGAPMYRENLAFPVVGAFLATFLYNLVLLVISYVVGVRMPWGSMLWRVALPQALTQAVLMPLAYWAADRLDRRLHRRIRIG
jgi:rod shape-determining protein MreD